MLPPSLPPRRLLPLFATLSTLPLADRSRVLGTLLVGAPGAGKTILLSLLLLFDLLRGLPGCVLDPLGTLSEAFLFRLAWFLSEFPAGDDELLWQRLRYVPLGEEPVTRFPIYFQRDGESLWDAGHRLITVLERASPQLVSGSPLTWPAARRLGVNAGMLLTALGYGGLTKIEDLLFHPMEWQNNGRFDEAIRRNPQAKDAVSYFRNSYLPLPRSEQRRVAGTFLDQVYPVVQNPTLQAIFSGSNTPGIDWEEVEALGQIVILNFKGITDPIARSFAEQWSFESLYPHLKTRGRRHTPFVVTIDEFANLAASGTGDNKPLADLFDELLAQYARNNQVFVTAALQSVDQVDHRLRQTLLRLGTIITGRAGSLREARVIADHLFRKDIYRIHHHKKVFGKVDPPPYIRGLGYRLLESLSLDKQRSPYYPYYILDYEPQYMGLELQEEDAAGTIQQLGALEFLCRPAAGEVVPLAIADAITDPDTGEYVFPDPDQDAALIARIQQQLAARSGIPIAEILREQEEWLTDGIIQTPPKPQPAGELDGRQPSDLSENGSRPDPAHLEPQPAKVTQSHPTLDDQQKVMLAFLIEHPDMPVSSVYKALGLSGRKGVEIRERLREQGFIQELEVRADRGRPLKFVIPTMQALEFFEKDPPAGRGGMLHRHVQQVVAAGAVAKGYTATCEKVLSTGGIVDVHLEKGNERIAVEIAISSTIERESTHIRNCLAAGYDKVVALIADENLRQRIATALHETCPEDLERKVRLLPLSKLAHVVYG